MDEKPLPTIEATGPASNIAHLIKGPFTKPQPNGAAGQHLTRGSPPMNEQKAVHKVGPDLPPYKSTGEDNEQFSETRRPGERGADKGPRKTKHGQRLRSADAIGMTKKRFGIHTHDIALVAECSDSYITQMEISGQMPGWMMAVLETIAHRLQGSNARGSVIYMVSVPKGDKDEYFQNMCKGFSLLPKKIDF